MTTTNLIKSIEKKKMEDPKVIWEYIQKDKTSTISDIVKLGKPIDKDSVECLLVYLILDQTPEGRLYRHNRIQLNGNIEQTTHIFNLIFGPEYEEKLNHKPEEMIGNLLGMEHYPVIQYANNKHIITGKTRVGGEIDKGPYSFIHPLRVTLSLHKKKSPPIAKDDGSVHDVPEDTTKYRSEELIKHKQVHSDLLRKRPTDKKTIRGLEEKITSLEKDIKSPPEFEEIRALLAENPEYADTLVEHTKAITQLPGETYKEYISRLITSCEQFYRSRGLIKRYFDQPISVKLEDNLDNTIHFRELRYEKQFERLDDNYTVLELTYEFLKKYNANPILYNQFRELFEVSFRRLDTALGGYWTDMVDKRIKAEAYKKPIEVFKEEFDKYEQLWKKIYGNKPIPSMFPSVAFLKSKLN